MYDLGPHASTKYFELYLSCAQRKKENIALSIYFINEASLLNDRENSRKKNTITHSQKKVFVLRYEMINSLNSNSQIDLPCGPLFTS